MVLEYNGSTSIPDYWISLNRQQKATESDKHTNATRPRSWRRGRAKDGAQTANQGHGVGPDFVFPAYPSPAPGALHRRQKKATPNPRGPLLPTVSVQRLAKRKSEARRGQLADIIFTNITRTQLHVGWTRARVEENSTGFLFVTVPIKAAAALPLFHCPTVRRTRPPSHFQRDAPRSQLRFTVILGAVLLLDFAVFCVHSQVDGRDPKPLPVEDFQCKSPGLEAHLGAITHNKNSN